MEDLWDFTGQDKLIYTDKINGIMNQQCKTLSEHTNGIVSASFGKIHLEGSVIEMVKALGVAAKTIPKINMTEEVGDLSTKHLIDANDLYDEARYRFIIFTETYKFRLFDLLVKPIYPVVISIDEGINKEIVYSIERICEKSEKPDTYIIKNEEELYSVLRLILTSRKVHYIINALLKQHNESEEFSDRYDASKIQKVIICEGKTDELFLHAIAKKLNKEVATVSADGKSNIPKIVEAVNKKHKKIEIMVLVDSDGDENAARATLEGLDIEDSKVVVINGTIEEWFFPDRTGFSKIKLLQNIDEIVKGADFEKLEEKDTSFKEVIQFIIEE